MTEDAPRTKRVLVVDDSALERKLIADTLAVDGWEIVGEAADGQEAVAQYELLKPGAVTLDIVMPGTDGIFALEHIRQYDPDAKVVIVSVCNQTKLISEAIEKGAQDFIPKPFLPEQLQEIMNGCLEVSAGA